MHVSSFPRRGLKMCINVKKKKKRKKIVGFVIRLYTFLPHARNSQKTRYTRCTGHTRGAQNPEIRMLGDDGLYIYVYSPVTGKRVRERMNRRERGYRFFFVPKRRKRSGRGGAWHRNGQCKSPHCQPPRYTT